ncbi:MAG: hypothetical protein ACPIOQ_10970, partial [Promethearchaeia archaeon]
MNKVVCLPNTTRDLRGQVDEAASDPADLVVAVAMHNRQINAFTGGSASQTLHPEAIVPLSSTGQELWSVDERLQADWLSILERFRPSAAIRKAMHSLLLGTPLVGVDSYVGVHWRRGDRAHPEMGQLGARMWELSTPDHLSCEINRLLLEFNVSSVFVGTNCGTAAEYDRLRELVQAPVVFLRDVNMFQEWQQGLDAMTTEMFLLAHAKVFLSAGESHWGSSTISRLIINLRRGGSTDIRVGQWRYLSACSPLDANHSSMGSASGRGIENVGMTKDEWSAGARQRVEDAAGGAGAAVRKEQTTKDSKSSWGWWTDDATCDADVTVFVSTPCKGMPVCVQQPEPQNSSGPDHVEAVDTARDDDDDVYYYRDKDRSARPSLLISGALIIWTDWRLANASTAERQEGAGAGGMATSVQDLEHRLGLVVRLDGRRRTFRNTQGSARLWQCSGQVGAFAKCLFEAKLVAGDEAREGCDGAGDGARCSTAHHPMNPGLHSLIVSVEDFGPGGSESGRDGGHVTAMSGALLGESSEISFEIVPFSSKDDTRCSAHSRKASLSEGASADAEAADQGEEWQRHENNWHWWMMMFYQQVSRQASLAGASSGVSAPTQSDGEERRVADFDAMRDMPIFISNMPHDSDRLSHMRTLLGDTLSFRNVSSFPMIPALDSGKVKLLVESGQMHRCAMRRFGANGMKAAGGAIAHAMSIHRLFQELAADSEGPEFVGIFEDDLLLTSDAHEVKQRIRDALKQLPPSADVLYLEVSWESCKDIRFNHEHPAIVRAARPSGGA